VGDKPFEWNFAAKIHSLNFQAGGKYKEEQLQNRVLTYRTYVILIVGFR